METSGRISVYRDRLDKTLASPDLTNAEALKSLIKNQLQSTSLNNDEEFSEDLLERRAREVSHFLEMLRSASITNKASEKSHSEWKLKQDTEEFRVMYREGPPGTPFHMLLVEGYVDGPMDACLCVSWEAALYKKWWPDYNVPTFKVISSKCVHKIRIGEQISVVRMKVSWPLSAREAVVQYFVFEYFKDDLIVVLLNSVDETEDIDKGTHGFTKDILPEAKDVVRMGVVGGLAMQKVTSSRSYFRTIASIDLKFDFVPPSLINFVSRHLTASGFKLYQKAVGSVFNSDEQFKKVLSDPLYSRIRDSLYSPNQQNVESDPIKNGDSNKALKTHLLEATKDETEEPSEVGQERTNEIDQDITKNQTTLYEIEEEISPSYEEETKNDPLEELPCSTSNTNNAKKKVCVSPEVEEALRTLEKVITLVKERGLNPNSGSSSSSDEESENVGRKESTEGGREVPLTDRVSVLASNGESVVTLSEETRNSSSSHGSRNKKSNSLREVNHNKVAPSSLVENLDAVPDPAAADSVVFSPKQPGPFPDLEAKETVYGKDEVDRSSKNGKRVGGRRRKYILWCFHPGSSSSRRSFG